MKKIITLFLVMVFLLGASAYADVDLSAMSKDELISLRTQIDQLIGYSLQGSYTTGVDIKEGYYSLYTPEGFGTYVFIFSNAEDALIDKDPLMATLLKNGETTTIHLVDGYVLRVSQGTVLLNTVEAPSWMP